MVTFKVKHINKVTAKGRTYYYDRITGKRIKAPFGTTAFILEVEALREGSGKQEKKALRSGTLGSLIHAYRASPEFTRLAARTKDDYQKVFDYLKPLNELALIHLDSAYIFKVRDKAFAKHKRRFANYVCAVLSVLFNWGIPRNHCDANPATNIPKIRPTKDHTPCNRAWTDEEYREVMAVAPKELKVAIAIGRYVGLREGDMVKLPLSAYKPPSWLMWRQSKTGDVVEIPVHAALYPYLEWARRNPKRKATTLVVGARGNPFTTSGFRARFFKIIRKLKQENKIGDGLTYHGLRHTVGSKLAELGADDFTIQAVLGHKTPTMAQTYRRDANKKVRASAGIQLMEKNK